MKTSRTPLTQRAKRFRLATGLLTLGLAAAGCTILAPIREPEHDRRFAVDIKDSEEVPCVDKIEGHGRLCTADVKEKLNDYYGDLGRAMWETDLRRRKLITLGVEKSQLNSVYNALLWPLGAYFITKKIHEPDWSTLDTAAVATATYGLMNSGIPDRDKAYLQAASRMACTMVAFEPYMYRVDRVLKNATHDDKDPAPLELRIERLDSAIQHYQHQRDRLVVLLEAKPGEPAPAAEKFNSVTAVRAEVQGRRKAPVGVPAGDLKGFLEGFQGATDRQLADARAQLLEARKNLVLLRTSGTRLRQIRGRIDLALTQALVAGTPGAVSPEARAQSIATTLQNHMLATKAFSDKVNTIRKQGGTAQETLWSLSDLRLRELSKTSRTTVVDFWNSERAVLIDALHEVASWQDDLQSNLNSAAESLSSLGCDNGSLDDFSKQLLKLINDAADAGAAVAAAAAAQAAASGASK